MNIKTIKKKLVELHHLDDECSWFRDNPARLAKAEERLKVLEKELREIGILDKEGQFRTDLVKTFGEELGAKIDRVINEECC